MEQQKRSSLMRLFTLLLAAMVLLGVGKACLLREDPRQAVTSGVLLKLNDQWERETDCQAGYTIPSGIGEGLMLSVKTVKQPFTLVLRGEDGQEDVFYTYQPAPGPAELRLFIALPDGAAGETLILRTGRADALSYMMRSEAVLGSQAKLTLHYFWSNLYALVFVIFCLLCAAGLGVLLVSMHGIFDAGFRHQACVMIGLILDAGVWILTDSELLVLATDKASLVAFCSLVSFGLTAPLTLEFVRCTLREECGSLRWPQAAMFALLAADALGWILADKAMFWLLVPIHLTIVVSIVLAFRGLLKACRKDRSSEARDILRAFGVLAVSVLLSLLFFYRDHVGRQYALFYCLGLLGFLLLLGRIILHRVKLVMDEQAELKNYKRLAYVDSLTGLSNYTAFKYLKSRWPERTDWVYVVMDVNWLKQTNDKYGHTAGDELLCSVARCIKEAFYRAESCCRIGGDEFIAVGMTAEKVEVEAAAANMRRLCAEWNARTDYPVSVAIGYAMQNGREMTADELFAEADAAMYQNKTEIKQAVGDTVR